MIWSGAQRRARRHSVTNEDQRDRFQRDRDRILYSSAFRRLAGVTQIVRAGESDVFHTRQQHTLKVAQVGRRLAERLLHEQSDLCESLGSIHPEVVEAACLAHDLGHPPFGHIGEHLLDELVSATDPDGFEGNAQSFRVLTKLAVRFEEVPGLDLTRATLAATLKYPWLRDPGHPGRSKKWNAYRTEAEDFRFARERLGDDAKTPEAAIMDWADDIAYSVHDLEDFHRCGAIPWHRILGGDQAERIVERATAAWFGCPVDARGRLREALRNLATFLRGGFSQLLNEPYEGTRHQRQQLRTMTSQLIGRYIKAARLREPEPGASALDIAQDESDEVRILKQITRDYIINNPSLAAQQRGQERLIRDPFDVLHEDARSGPPRYLPHRLAYLFDLSENSPARFAADCISSLSEAEATALHARLFGLSGGSVLDPIVR